MSKNQFFDVVPPGSKRSIRDIPLPNKPTKPKEEDNIMPRKEYVYEDYEYVEKGPSKKIWYVLGVLVLIAIVYASSFLFHKATITITPRKVQTNLSNSIVAKTNPAPNEVMYDVVTLTETESRSVPATGEVEVSRKASGNIIIYNNHSDAPQELVKNTRFESVSGKIYRIAEAVVVPGQKTTGGEKVPGSVKVVVYADEAGESYNSGPTDFTIPGFKGSDKYKGFTAKSDGAIAGGLVGKEQSVDEKTLESTIPELQKSLEAKLLQSIASQIPKDFVMLKGAHGLSYRSLPIEKEGTNAKVTLEGTITAKVFRKSDLETALSSNPGEKVRINSFDNLSVEISEDTPGVLTLKPSGSVEAFAYIDELKLKEDVKGKPKKSILAIISSHSEIDSATVKISPFWIMSAPKVGESITVVDTSTARAESLTPRE